MKHSVVITLILLSIFITTQFFGLAVIQNYMDHDLSDQEGKPMFESLPFGERPEVDTSYSPFWLLGLVLISTMILLLIIKFKLNTVWKGWFFLAVLIGITTSLGAFVSSGIAFSIALLLTIWKVFKPNVVIHNFTEIFVYAGVAGIAVPFFTIKSASILLIIFSIYDMYAVWKSKHMIVLAKAQSSAGVFAGLMIPYSNKKITKNKKVAKNRKKSKKQVKVKTAMLGGGDLALPLIFAGVVMVYQGFLAGSIIAIFSTLSLAGLFLLSKSGKFYPAMPFISLGCFIGLGITLLL